MVSQFVNCTLYVLSGFSHGKEPVYRVLNSRNKFVASLEIRH